MTSFRQIRIEHSPIIAEISEISPTWHVARCAPGSESLTALNLSARRFGAYLPLADAWDRQHVTKQAALFPGYVFVYLWGLAQHVRKVQACPGVSGFLLDADAVPVTVPDAVMRDIQIIEWKNYLKHLPRSFFRRRQHNENWIIPLWRSPNYGFASPPAEARNSALHRALGLTNSQPHTQPNLTNPQNILQSPPAWQAVG